MGRLAAAQRPAAGHLRRCDPRGGWCADAVASRGGRSRRCGGGVRVPPWTGWCSPGAPTSIRSATGRPGWRAPMHLEPDRDAWEIALVRAARSDDLPILAVCRGLQLLNVALGGTLVQDLPTTVGNHTHRGEVGSFIGHPITMAPDTELARDLRTGRGRSHPTTTRPSTASPTPSPPSPGPRTAPWKPRPAPARPGSRVSSGTPRSAAVANSSRPSWPPAAAWRRVDHDRWRQCGGPVVPRGVLAGAGSQCLRGDGRPAGQRHQARGARRR